MKKFVAVLFCASFLISCGGGSNTEKDLKKYEETKKKLAETENENPLNYLTIIADDKKNLFGQTVVKGIIENKASVAAYKKVRVKLLYYKNGVLVTNHEEVYDDVIMPNNRHEFKAKYFTPKGTDSVGVSIMSAETFKTPSN